MEPNTSSNYHVDTETTTCRLISFLTFRLISVPDCVTRYGRIITKEIHTHRKKKPHRFCRLRFFGSVLIFFFYTEKIRASLGITENQFDRCETEPRQRDPHQNSNLIKTKIIKKNRRPVGAQSCWMVKKINMFTISPTNVHRYRSFCLPFRMHSIRA